MGVATSDSGSDGWGAPQRSLHAGQLAPLLVSAPPLGKLPWSDGT